MPVDLQHLDPDALQKLMPALDALRKAGIDFNVTSGARSYARQAQIYQDYLGRGKTGLPAAPPGHSRHESGLAVDIALSDEGQRPAANQVMAKFGWQWPLGARDRVHYQFDPNAAPPGVGSAIPTGRPLTDFPSPPAAAPSPQYLTEFPAPPAAKAAPHYLTEFPAPKGQGAATGLLTDFPAPKPGRGRLGQPLAPGFYGGQQVAPEPPPRHVSVPTGTIPGVPPPGGSGAAMPPQAIDTRQTAVPKPIQAVESGVGRAITTVGTGLSAYDAFVNQVARERAHMSNQKAGQPLTIGDEGRAVLQALAKTPWGDTIKQGLKGQKFVGFDPVITTRQEMQGGEGALLRKAPPWVASALDLALSFPAQEIPGVAQAELVSAAGKALAKLHAATGASEKLLEKLPALRASIEKSRAFKQGQTLLNTHQATTAQRFLPEAAATAEDLRQTSQKYLKAGVPIRGVNPHTNQPLNEFDALVADYIDAGAPGSKHEALGDRAAQLRPVQAEAAAKGIDYADVVRIGDRFGAQLDTLGQRLVHHGLLDADAYQALKGQYLPRLYLMTKGSAEDVTAYLKFLDEQGALTAAGKRELLQEASSTQRYSRPGAGPQAFTKQREITTFAERNDPAAARAAIPEATPAALHGITAQTRALGEAEGHAAIAADPFLAQPVATAPGHYVNFTGKGPLAGMAVHPGIAQLLEYRKSEGTLMQGLRDFARQGPAQKKVVDVYLGAQRALRHGLLSSPKTAWNVVTGHYDLMHNGAALHGVSFLPHDMIAAQRDLLAAGRGGKVDPYLQEALTKTDILSETHSLIPRQAARVGSGFGVETRGQMALGATRKAASSVLNLPRHITHDLLKAGRFGLYRKLRRSGMDIDQAAGLVRSYAINYRDVHPLIRALERHNIAPFITYPIQAVTHYLHLALRRPDLFYTSTGQRARDFLDQMADQYARGHGQQPVARQKRQKGEVGLGDFPLPGKFDAAGRQQYFRSGLLAPALHHIIRGGEEANPLKETLNNALPGLRLMQQFANNETGIKSHKGEAVPIVPEGSIPGVRATDLTNPQVLGAYALHAGKAVLPFASDLEEMVHAARGEPSYPSLAAPVPTVAQAILRAVMGIRTGPNLGRNRLEQSLMAGENAQKLEGLQGPYAQFALAYGGQLFQRRAQDPGFTPDEHLQQIADGYDDKTLQTAAENAGIAMARIVQQDKATGDERKAKIRRYIDWVWALAMASGKRVKSQSESLTPAEQEKLPAMVKELP